MLSRRIALALLAAAMMSGCGEVVDPRTDSPSGAASGASGAVERITDAQVVRVIDGDTLHARASGHRSVLKVRLVGIDTPETTTLRSGSAECGGREAEAALAALVRRSPTVTLLTDARQGARDRYGRLLAYVEPSGGGDSFQLALLEAGWAAVYESRDGFTRAAQFRAAAARARQAGRGIWQGCGGDFRRPLER